MRAILSLRPGFIRGLYVVTHVVDGLPKGHEARIINHGSPEYPNWRLWLKMRQEGAMAENQTSYDTAEEALLALRQDLGAEQDERSDDVQSGPAALVPTIRT